MHSHSRHTSFLHYLGGCVLILSIAFVSVLWWQERKQFSAVQTYQAQLTKLHQLATELSTQSGNDALITQTIATFDLTTQEVLAHVPEAQKNTWSATQSRAVGTLLSQGKNEQQSNIDAYTELTSRLVETIEQSEVDFVQAITLQQNYAQLLSSETQPIPFARIQHNYHLLEQRLNLRAWHTILGQTTQTNILLEQAKQGIHALLDDNKRLMTHLEQFSLPASDQELLACRATLLQAFRREQKEAVAVMSMLTLANEAQTPVMQTCIQQRERCLTTPQRPARHTGLQAVSSGVLVLAAKYAQLHTLRAQGAPLDEQQLCVRRNKLPQNTNDLQDSLERALEQRDQLTTPQGSTVTTIDQSGSAGTEKLFDNRQQDALQDIEERQQQWLQETEGTSGDSFRKRLDKFFKQFDGKR